MQQGGDGDSEIAKPDKFTGRDARKLRPFIASCIMAFDNKPRKFQNDRQRVSYAASFLSDVALLWWQPFLAADPEPAIRNSWAEFVFELNRLFGEPNLVQSAEQALKQLRMKENQRLNKYMIEFAEHAPYTNWNDAALYSAFYTGLADRIKDQLCLRPRTTTLNDLKQISLDIDDRHWERESEKIPTNFRSRATSSPKPGHDVRSTDNRSTNRSTRPPPKSQTDSHSKDLGNVLGSDGKLTEAERERRKNKGLCMYCGEPPNRHARNCNYTGPAPSTTGRATFTLSGEPQTASIEEVPESDESNEQQEN